MDDVSPPEVGLGGFAGGDELVGVADLMDDVSSSDEVGFGVGFVGLGGFAGAAGALLSPPLLTADLMLEFPAAVSGLPF